MQEGRWRPRKWRSAHREGPRDEDLHAKRSWWTMLQTHEKELKPEDEDVQKIEALGARIEASKRNWNMYRLESCACSFLHVLFSTGFWDGVFSEPCTCKLWRAILAIKVWVVLCLFLYEHLLIKSYSTGYNLVAKGATIGGAHIHVGQLPLGGPLGVDVVSYKLHPHQGAIINRCCLYIMLRA